MAWQALCSTLPKAKKGKRRGKAYPICDLYCPIASEGTAAAVVGPATVIDLISPSPEPNPIVNDIINLVSGSDSDHDSSDTGSGSDSDSNDKPSGHSDSEISDSGSKSGSDTDSGSDSDSDQVSGAFSAEQGIITVQEQAGEHLNASTMTRAELEQVLGRSIPIDQTGVARYEAAIVLIEAREARTAQQKASSKQDELLEQERCRQYEQGIMDSLEEAGGIKAMNAVTAGIPMIMLDSGTYRHIWGTDLLKCGLVQNITNLPKPEKVDTAAGEVTLKQTGTVQLRGITFKGVINRHMRMSRIQATHSIS